MSVSPRYHHHYAALRLLPHRLLLPPFTLRYERTSHYRAAHDVARILYSAADAAQNIAGTHRCRVGAGASIGSIFLPILQQPLMDHFRRLGAALHCG